MGGQSAISLGRTRRRINWTNQVLVQNGKQGENKNLASANASAMAEGAGQSQ